MQKKRKKNVGIFIFDLVEVLDFSGPYEVFSSARLTKKSTPSIQNNLKLLMFLLFQKKKYISASGGLKVKSDFTLKTVQN